MWDLGSRDIIVLVSVISGWAVLLNIFGPFVGSTITIGVILCGWLIHNISGVDTPLTPHIFSALDCLEQTASETHRFLKHICQQFILSILIVARNLRRRYRINIVERMAQRRRSTYQLSSETGASSQNFSRFSLVDGLSPIARGHFRTFDNSTNLENAPFPHTERRLLERTSSLGQLTSTPLLSWRKENTKNGDVLTSNHDVNTWKNAQTFTPNHTLSRGEETNYSPEGSPWGTSISPKMRPRAAGIKTVQTVAGPLLASTRYNIDPKVYSDVTSPGLTTRLTKYATEANTKLTHQSQYGTGQFPRVNLNSSPTPLINAKTGKMRMPVTVRLAPLENTRNVKYEKQKILSEICQAERKEQQQPSVVQVLREISLKRHASREDVTYEMAKKQRTENLYSEGLENLEEMTQKRGRDDSSRSEEETSPHSKTLRPAKRSKMPSCHDILSSLSSSINVSSGVKRKAIDASRSGTPVVGKHFKSLDSSQGDTEISASLSRSISEPTRSSKRVLNDLETRTSDLQRPPKRSLESLPQKVIEEPCSPSKQVLNIPRTEARSTTQEISERKVQPVVKIDEAPVKLTEKLFMKARPENIDKIKTLIEEHGSTKPRFTTNSTDEIKKSDIINMRQTSMKNRLKSMFDAISGKGTSKINPEVVIQAEDKSTSPESIVVSLSSTTSTTNVNTSPIASSAIVPIIGKSKPTTTPAKHVTFQFSNNDPAPKTSSSLETPRTSTVETKIGEIVAPREEKTSENSKVEITSMANSVFACSNPATSSVSSSIFTSPLKSASQISSSIPTQVSKPSIPASSSVSVTSSPSTPQFGFQMFNSASTTSMFGIPTTTITKSGSSPLTGFQSNEKNPSAVNFSFGVSKTGTVTSTSQSVGSLANQQTSDVKIESTPTSIVAAVTTTSSSGLFSFTSAAKPTVSETSSTFNFEAPRSADQEADKGAAGKTGFWGASGEAAATVPKPTFSFEGTSPRVAVTSTGFTYPTEIRFGDSVPTCATCTGFSASTSTPAAFTIGGNTNSIANAKPGFSFGSTAPATSSFAAFSSPIDPATSFGVTSSNSTAPVFAGASTMSSATTQPSIFGVPATTSSAPSQPSLFGTPATTATATTSQPSVFGAPATTTSAAPVQPSIFAFGTGSGQTASFPNTFGLPKSNTPTKPEEQSKSAGNTFPFFEASKNDAFGVKSSSGIPGNSGAAPSYTFSNTTTPAFGTPNTAPPAFGSTNTSTTSFGATTTAATTFGSLNTITPTFGALSSSTVTTANQNTASLSFNAPSATFGAATTTTAPPAFPTASPSGFGTSASTFGTSTNPPPAFSTTKTFSSFGAPANTASPFGSQPSPANPSFGAINQPNTAFGANTNSNNNNANPSFTFGSSQPNPQPPQQQNAVFTFGGAQSTPANNTTTGSSGFQFKPAAQQTGGFNFTGAPAAPAINFSKDGASGSSFALPTPGANSFSVPPATGGMFSIGTGSTAPRTRPNRRRQR